jgi:large repetitive protein
VTFSIAATGSAPIKLTESGRLPRGLSFTTTGGGTASISGTTLTLGSYTVTITATNGVKPAATQKLTVVVGFAPVFLTPGSSTFVVGQHAAFLVGTFGYPPGTLTESGTLPKGLRFKTTGSGLAIIEGTPATGTEGVHRLTVRATNGFGTSTESLTVAVDEAPHFTSTNSTTFTPAVLKTFTITTSGYPAARIIELGALPKGVVFKTTGAGKATLSGTPTTKRKTVYKVKLTAGNGVGRSVVQPFTLTVT